MTFPNRRSNENLSTKHSDAFQRRQDGVENLLSFSKKRHCPTLLRWKDWYCTLSKKRAGPCNSRFFFWRQPAKNKPTIQKNSIRVSKWWSHCWCNPHYLALFVGSTAPNRHKPPPQQRPPWKMITG